MYIQYVERRYGKVTIIVFDGYDDGPSTKHCTHQRRTTSFASGMQFTSDMIIPLKKNEFLSNQEHKQRCTKLLSHKLRIARCSVFQVSGNVDLLIIQTAAPKDMGIQHQSCWWWHWPSCTLALSWSDECKQLLHLIPEPKQQSKALRVWNIKMTKLGLGIEVCSSKLLASLKIAIQPRKFTEWVKAVALRKIQNSVHYCLQAMVNSGGRERFGLPLQWWCGIKSFALLKVLPESCYK